MLLLQGFEYSLELELPILLIMRVSYYAIINYFFGFIFFASYRWHVKVLHVKLFFGWRHAPVR